MKRYRLHKLTRCLCHAGEMVRVQLTLLRLLDEVESVGTSWAIRVSATHETNWHDIPHQHG